MDIDLMKKFRLMQSLLLSVLLYFILCPKLFPQSYEVLRDVGRMGDFQLYEIDLDGYHMKVDEEGNIYIAGRFSSGTFYVGYGLPDLEDINSPNNYFVAKYSPKGILLWASPVYSDEFNPGGLVTLVHPILCLYVDDLQNVYITGTYAYEIYSEHCSSEITEVESSNLYYAKFNRDGKCEFIKTGRSPVSAKCTGITKSRDGRLFISGRFGDRIQFDDTLLIGTADPEHSIRESFIAEITRNGEISQFKTLRSTPGNSSLEIHRMLIDSQNKLVLAGECRGRILIDDELIGDKDADMFIAPLTLELEKHDVGNWRYGYIEDGSLIKIYDLDELPGNRIAVSGFFMGAELKMNKNSLSGVEGKFRHFLTTIDFDSDNEILISTAGLRPNGQTGSVQSSTDGDYLYVLSTISDTGTIGNAVIIEPDPKLYYQYLATIDPNTGECLSLSKLDIVKKVIGMENFTNKIVIAGNFDNSFKLGDFEVITGPFDSDIYFAILDITTVKTNAPWSPGMVNVYPNPATDKLYLNGDVFDDIIIYNMQGQVIKVMQKQRSMIDINHLDPGVYLISLLNGSEIQTAKFIKK